MEIVKLSRLLVDFEAPEKDLVGEKLKQLKDFFDKYHFLKAFHFTCCYQLKLESKTAKKIHESSIV